MIDPTKACELIRNLDIAVTAATHAEGISNPANMSVKRAGMAIFTELVGRKPTEAEVALFDRF